MPTANSFRYVPKAASYSPSLGTDTSGTVFTTRGATGAVTFTLPKPGFQYVGTRYIFNNVVDQNMIVAGKSAGDVVTFNNNNAASLAASTAGQKIGARIVAEIVETVKGTFKWLLIGETSGVTYTVA